MSNSIHQAVQPDAVAPADPPAAESGVMPAGQRAAFEAELSRLKASNTSGPIDRRLAVVGLVAAVVGLVVILTCYSKARSFDDVRDQMEMLVLSLFGLGLVFLGTVVYVRFSISRFLRYWLLRAIYEQRSGSGGGGTDQP